MNYFQYTGEEFSFSRAVCRMCICGKLKQLVFFMYTTSIASNGYFYQCIVVFGYFNYFETKNVFFFRKKKTKPTMGERRRCPSCQIVVTSFESVNVQKEKQNEKKFNFHQLTVKIKTFVFSKHSNLSCRGITVFTALW